MKVSQSARKREAFRYLNERYGLTEFEAASVVAEVKARAPKEIRSLVPYLAGMKEGDLADIVGAVQNRTAEMTAPAEPGESEAAHESDAERPARPAMPEWCGHCDRRTRLLELLDGRPKRCPTCHPLREETA